MVLYFIVSLCLAIFLNMQYYEIKELMNKKLKTIIYENNELKNSLN